MDNNHPTHLFQEVAAIKDGTLCTVTHYAIGRNGDSESNSIYIRLFCDWLPMSVMSIYANEFWKLPKEWQPIVDDALVTGKTLKPKKTGISDKEDAEDRKLLKPLPIAADIVRYAFDQKSDDASAKRWRFYAIYRFFTYKPKTNEQKTSVTDSAPILKSQGDCWQWGVDSGAFSKIEHAKEAYAVIKQRVNPTSPDQMYTAWIAHVNKILKEAV